MTIDEKKKTILAAWRLEEVAEVPFVVEVGPLHVATTEFYDDDAKELSWHQAMHKKREKIDDYGWPNVKPNQGVNIVAAAFGCPQTVNTEGDPWVKPLITEDNIDDVRRLEVPDPLIAPPYLHAWKRLDFLQSRTNWPLRVVNVPSPLTTASCVCDNTAFLTSLIEYPEEMHILLDKCTEAIIAYVNEQFKRIKNLYSVGHESMCPVPRECGVRISDDTAALLSPGLYREFGLPYNARIAEAFGGVVIHSCGDTHNVAPVMAETPGIRGLDLTLPQVKDWDKVAASCAGKVTLCLRHQYWDHLESEKVDMLDYTKRIIGTFGRKGVIIQTSAATEDEAVRYAGELHELLSK
jgi:hypothetical protein